MNQWETQKVNERIILVSNFFRVDNQQLGNMKNQS